MMSISPSTTITEGEGRIGTANLVGWLKPTITFLAFFTSIWLLLWASSVALPLIRPGAEIIAAAKFERMITGSMFAAQDRNRLMFFGNSKALSGVRPLEFDSAFGSGTRSYNLGLPGEGRFLPILESALRMGNVPTHVLLTISWGDQVTQPGILQPLKDDAGIADVVLPFRTLPRDLILFAYNSRLHLLLAAREAAAERDVMVTQRGWYFIKGQSHFADDRLPVDYGLPTDRPDQPETRKVPEHSLVRERLESLAASYGFQIVLIPSYLRTGEAAPPSMQERERSSVISRSPLIRVLGPDYWTYPPPNFSDPVHLNPSGATTYTARLVDLLKKNQVAN